MESQRVGAIITAAGQRKNKVPFEALKELGNITIVKRLVLTLQRVGVSPIVVITGEQAEEVERQLSNFNVVFLRNENYKQTHMFESAKIGFEYLLGKVERVILTKVDVPLFTSNTVKRILEAKGEIISPVYRGKTGHPLSISATLIPDILQYDGCDGMKGFLHTKFPVRQWIDVEDEGIIREVYEVENREDWIREHNDQMFRSDIKLSLGKEKLFFDARAKMLLLLIEETHSVRGACKKIALSYSKAWNLINEMEDMLGFPVVERQHGGKYGGKTYLSKEGKQFLNRYLVLEESVRFFAEEQFQQIFQQYLE